ncbi:LLM class flavin-dependent oxidoreductase [Leucothrix sargassi]|nr:LLM class flavin-dependent oxidoreductase [Leucothrix sargassi]
MAQTQRTLCVGMSLATTWLSGNAWRKENSRVEEIYNIEYYIELAQKAELAKMDFVFFPDSLFIDTNVVAHSAGFSALDPTLSLASIAQSTHSIGLLTTASTTFYEPYIVARQLQTLHHISKGRAAWNVVTALDGYANFGLSIMPDTETRYARAAEFVEAVEALWHSFPQEALVLDRNKGCYANPSLIRAADYQGQHVSSKGPLSVPAHPAGDVPLFQAGASEKGKAFAAKIAAGVFAATPDKEVAKELRTELKNRAAALGRDPNDIRLMPGLNLYLASTREDAQALYQETSTDQMRERQRRLISDSLGVDLDGLGENDVVSASMMGEMKQVRSKSHSLLVRRLVEKETMTLAELFKRPEVSASGHWQVIGTVEDAVKAIVSWAEDGAIDGFIALPGGNEACFDLICHELMPALANLGWFREEYSGSTFLSHLQQASHTAL